jgi:putative hemolysin
MAALGRVPVVGDRFGWRGYTFEVLDMDGRRVDKLLATVNTANGNLEPGKQHH